MNTTRGYKDVCQSRCGRSAILITTTALSLLRRIRARCRCSGGWSVVYVGKTLKYKVLRLVGGGETGSKLVWPCFGK